MADPMLPLLPLILDDVPAGLCQALARQGVPFCRREEENARGRFLLFDSRRNPRPAPRKGQTAIDVDLLRRGFDVDPFEQLADEQSARMAWRVEGITVCEEVARVDKRRWRQVLMMRLREEIERGGGVWVCLAAFPYPYRTALNLRIDYDEYDPIDFDWMLRALRGHEQATSHFVCGSAYADHAEALGRLAGLDVGSHGYRHHTYRTLEENRRNIARGIEVLEAAGLKPRGFAAPGGRFHANLLAAMQSLGIDHSSEFGLVYDELPLEPSGGRVLQIPVHPVCLGLFLEAAAAGTADDTATAAREAVGVAVRYFRRLVETRHRAGEPIFLYGHPTARLGRYPYFLETLLETASGLEGVWRTTLSQVAAWWRARSRLRLAVECRGGRLDVAAAGRRPGYRFGVELWREDRVAVIPLDGDRVQIDPAALEYERRDPIETARPVRAMRQGGLRNRVRRWIDWEKVTPAEEIPAGDWRNIAKRALRHWRPL